MSPALTRHSADHECKQACRAVAVMSMLHEPAAGSAVRLFRGRPVLRWTLDRLADCIRLASVTVLCWDDQAAPSRAIAGSDINVIAKGDRKAPVALDAITVSRMWAEGWRGGLLGTCAFDAGFHGPWMLDALNAADADAVVLIDPSAGLLDPSLIDGLIEHAGAHADSEICFVPAAPGLGAALLRKTLLERLAADPRLGSHPGRLLNYYPTQVSREMLAGDACAPAPTSAARTIHDFTLSSDRRVRRLEAATAGLNGQLAWAGADQIVSCVSASAHADAAGDDLPREVVLELNTRRISTPIFWPGRDREISRPDLTIDLARMLIEELAQCDDTRLTLAGVGDPVLSDNLLEIIEMAASCGLAVHVETDLLRVSPEMLCSLARSRLDVLSVHLPAMTVETYRAVMGIDGLQEALGNIETCVRERARQQRAVPILAPLFVKCRVNLAEMELWYDQWLAAVGSAVIIGPGTCGGLVADVSVADMSPPRRRPCARIARRATVLSDGRIVSCEEDVLARQCLGRLGEDRLGDVWRDGFAKLRAAHRREEWSNQALCAVCREWHRP